MIAHFHLPGLFEFNELYKLFIPLFYENREWFFEWCDIASVYGAPADCVWGGGRVGYGENWDEEIIELLRKYNISARLTFSNSLIREEHLSDKKCNSLCKRLVAGDGVIVHSDLLLSYLKEKYPDLYFVSSTTKVITDFSELLTEINREDFRYVVPDFRMNKCFAEWEKLSMAQKQKVELLCNECCDFSCNRRRECYENVSKKALGEECEDHICLSKNAGYGYRFSEAIKNPAFISVDDIVNKYMPRGFTEFKVEGRSLGSALILEFLLYYLTKPEYQINVREKIYLDSSLDLF